LKKRSNGIKEFGEKHNHVAGTTNRMKKKTREAKIQSEFLSNGKYLLTIREKVGGASCPILSADRNMKGA